jgi:hypothetical protein
MNEPLNSEQISQQQKDEATRRMHIPPVMYMPMIIGVILISLHINQYSEQLLAMQSPVYATPLMGVIMGLGMAIHERKPRLLFIGVFLGGLFSLMVPYIENIAKLTSS